MLWLDLLWTKRLTIWPRNSELPRTEISSALYVVYVWYVLMIKCLLCTLYSHTDFNIWKKEKYMIIYHPIWTNKNTNALNHVFYLRCHHVLLLNFDKSLNLSVVSLVLQLTYCFVFLTERSWLGYIINVSVNPNTCWQKMLNVRITVLLLHVCV